MQSSILHIIKRSPRVGRMLIQQEAQRPFGLLFWSDSLLLLERMHWTHARRYDWIRCCYLNCTQRIHARSSDLTEFVFVIWVAYVGFTINIQTLSSNMMLWMLSFIWHGIRFRPLFAYCFDVDSFMLVWGIGLIYGIFLFSLKEHG